VSCPSAMIYLLSCYYSLLSHFALPTHSFFPSASRIKKVYKFDTRLFWVCIVFFLHHKNMKNSITTVSIYIYAHLDEKWSVNSFLFRIIIFPLKKLNRTTNRLEGIYFSFVWKESSIILFLLLYGFQIYKFIYINPTMGQVPQWISNTYTQ